MSSNSRIQAIIDVLVPRIEQHLAKGRQRIAALSGGAKLYIAGLFVMCLLTVVIAWTMVPEQSKETNEISTPAEETPSATEVVHSEPQATREEQRVVEVVAPESKASDPVDFHNPPIASSFGDLVGHIEQQIDEDRRNRPSVSSLKTDESWPWSLVVELSEPELEQYFLLHGLEKINPPPEPDTYERDAERRRRSDRSIEENILAMEADIAAMTDMDLMHLYDEIGGKLEIPSRTRPPEVFPALRLFAHYMADHEKAADELRLRTAQGAQLFKKVARFLSGYPAADGIREAMEYMGYDGKTISVINAIIEYLERKDSENRPLNLQRVHRFADDLYEDLERRDRKLAELNRLIYNAERDYAETGGYLDEFTTGNLSPNTVRRRRHRYAVPRNDHLTISKWNWPSSALPSVTRDFDYWYQWATDTEWYAGTHLALDAWAYPKDAEKTKALWLDFRDLAEEEPDAFLSDRLAEILEAQRPPLRE